MIDSINGAMLREMFYAGHGLLEENREAIDVLNVFPVPDGDTGTNMSMTLSVAIGEVRQLQSNQVEKVASAMSRGALRGARGNSGVILSQIFRGFAKGLEGVDNITSAELAQALTSGVEMAYKAVMKPREGTILTVARSAAEYATRFARRQKDLSLFLSNIIDEAERTLQKTPEMLPVLKEAGVVDSGGRGFIVILAGFKMALDGEEMTFEYSEPYTQTPQHVVQSFQATEDIEFAYCTEFFVTNLRDDVDDDMVRSFLEKLERVGDSVVVVRDDDLIKVHVHSNVPGKILQLALRMGELSTIKIDNMKEQHRTLTDVAPPAEKAPEPVALKPYGMMTVCAGDGVKAIMKDLGVDVVVSGGQTMNPSTQDLLSAVESVPAETVFVFPNNANIILAAQQTVELTEKNVVVIPSKTLPQGIAAIITFDPDASVEDNQREMSEAMSDVLTGEVTYAVRDTSVNSHKIRQGDIIGIGNGQMLCVGNDVEKVAIELVEKLLDEDKEVITIFYGEDVSEEQAQALCQKLEENHRDCSVEVHFGGQPLYYYIVSVE
ncbi:MAG: DAK2 domain-containing protein [Christensenellales bacterium]|jgi:DAK2 domain fusion protein YloV